MPWRETSSMEERLKFVAEYLSGGYTMQELCAAYGVSRPTGYHWIERYQREGLAGLHDRSRRPHTSPGATAAAQVEAILALRRRQPHDGPRKLLTKLRRRFPQQHWPAASTVSGLLKRAGLITARRRRRGVSHPGHAPRAVTRVNEVWSMDFKGQFRTADGGWCYPLTVMDSCSRYLLGCQALRAPRRDLVVPVLVRLFRAYGLPERIRTDNGPPFASTGLGRLSALSVWWVRLGIWPELIAPGQPQQNGRHERMHKTLKAQTAAPPAGSRAAQQRRFTQFTHAYNTDRPHEALAQTTPASGYQPSPRAFPERLPRLYYPADFEVRRVVSSGVFKWHSHAVRLGEALSGEDIGLEPIADGEWMVYFGPCRLGTFDERLGRIRPFLADHGGRTPARPARADDNNESNTGANC